MYFVLYGAYADWRRALRDEHIDGPARLLERASWKSFHGVTTNVIGYALLTFVTADAQIIHAVKVQVCDVDAMDADVKAVHAALEAKMNDARPWIVQDVANAGRSLGAGLYCTVGLIEALDTLIARDLPGMIQDDRNSVHKSTV